MRIFHLLKHAQSANGSVNVAVDLACAQAQAGHDVWFVSSRGSYDDLLKENGVTVHTVTEPTSVSAAFRSLIEVVVIARRARPEILHAHMMSSAIIGFLTSKVAGSVLITTMHNSFDGHSWLMRLGKRVVAVSAAERTLLRSRHYPSWQLATVLNGTEGSAREALPVDEVSPLHRPAITTLSGLHERKAVSDVIKGFGLVHEEYPAWHLNIVGEGPQRSELEYLVRSHGLEAFIHFLGPTMTPKGLLMESEIYVHAALADPCPLTVMEARNAGCAIIGTSVGGIVEVLEYGNAGILVPPRSPESIAEALRFLLKEERVVMEWQARAARGAEYFSVSRAAREYESLYLTLLHGIC